MAFIEIIEDGESFEKVFPGYEETSFTLRRCSLSHIREWQKKHTSFVFDKLQKKEVEKVDTDKVDEEALDFCVTGWSGVISPVTGDDIPCTREYKTKLPDLIKVGIMNECNAVSISDRDKKKENSTNSKTT